MVFRLAPPSESPHPAVFLFLMLPFGVMAGYLTVTVVYLLTQAGISVEQSAALVALSYVPHTWKFLWAPIVDSTLSRKQWYLLSAGVTAVGTYATGPFLPTKAHCPCLPQSC
jgi:PAT family beta-lactamase induction signal transducer AmpG